MESSGLLVCMKLNFQDLKVKWVSKDITWKCGWDYYLPIILLSSMMASHLVFIHLMLIYEFLLLFFPFLSTFKELNLTKQTDPKVNGFGTLPEHINRLTQRGKKIYYSPESSLTWPMWRLHRLSSSNKRACPHSNVSNTYKWCHQETPHFFFNDGAHFLLIQTVNLSDICITWDGMHGANLFAYIIDYTGIKYTEINDIIS